jgi:hypothetical protein
VGGLGIPVGVVCFFWIVSILKESGLFEKRNG